MCYHYAITRTQYNDINSESKKILCYIENKYSLFFLCLNIIMRKYYPKEYYFLPKRNNIIRNFLKKSFL